VKPKLWPRVQTRPKCWPQGREQKVEARPILRGRGKILSPRPNKTEIHVSLVFLLHQELAFLKSKSRSGINNFCLHTRHVVYPLQYENFLLLMSVRRGHQRWGCERGVWMGQEELTVTGHTLALCFPAHCH